MPLGHGSGEVDRWSCFLREVRRVAPGLARCCDLCNSNDSFVLDGTKFPSKRRVQQCDLHGTLTGPCHKDETWPSPTTAVWT